MKWGWIGKAFTVLGIVSAKIPAIMADGKISIDEMVDLTTSILAVFDVPFVFEIPDEIKGTSLAARLGE